MKDSDVVIYTPASSLQHPAKMIRQMFRDLLQSRELAWRLAVRDISAQYRQTALGLLWAFIIPLGNTLVWVFLSSSGIVNIDTRSNLPYPAFVFSGTILWSIFSDALNNPLQQTSAAKPILAKINFPREAIILSGVYQTLFNATIKISLLIPALAFFQIYPNLNILLFPICLLSIVIIGTTIGLLVTPIGMLYTDVGKSIPLLMQFLMYASPVVFAAPQEGWGEVIFLINPLTPLINIGRNLLTGDSISQLEPFFWINIITVFLLLLVWSAYRLAMPILIERMSS